MNKKLVIVIVLIILATLFFARPASAISEDLVAQYNFEDGTSGDVVGNNDASFRGDANVVDSDRGKVASFDGNGDWLQIPGMINVQTDQTWSYGVWFKLDSLPTEEGDAMLFRYSDAGSATDAFLYIDDGTSSQPNRIKNYDGDKGDTGVEVSTGVWYHAVVVRDGGAYRIYVDGAQKNARTDFEFTVSSNTFAVFQHDGRNNWGHGFVDDIRIYDRALSSSEVNQVYNLEKDGSQPGEPGPEPNITCSIDSDCGENIIGENYCSNGDVFRDVTSKVCLNSGTPQSSCDEETESELVQSCQGIGCQNGACSSGIFKLEQNDPIQLERGAVKDIEIPVGSEIYDFDDGALLYESGGTYYVHYLDGKKMSLDGNVAALRYIEDDLVFGQQRSGGTAFLVVYSLTKNVEEARVDVQDTTTPLNYHFLDNKFVWRLSNNLHLYDLSTGVRSVLDSNVDLFAGEGDRVVYATDVGGEQILKSYDGNQIRTLVSSPLSDSMQSLDLHGDKLVGERSPADKTPRVFEIYAYDFSTEGEKQISNSGVQALNPRVHDDLVVWEDSKNPSGIYAYDFNTGRETSLVLGSGPEDPFVYEDVVVWETGSNTGRFQGTLIEEEVVTCLDDDGGLNYSVRGKTSVNTESQKDFCASNTVLTEYFCSNNEIMNESYDCSSEGKICQNGACVEEDVCEPQIKCSLDPPICPASGNQTEICVDENECVPDTEKEVSCNPGTCSGCLQGERCIPYGIRLDENYCDITGSFLDQKVAEASCQNDYECNSNVCSGGTCVDLKAELEKQSFFRRAVFTILCRIVNPISDDEYNKCLANFLGDDEPVEPGEPPIGRVIDLRSGDFEKDSLLLAKSSDSLNLGDGWGVFTGTINEDDLPGLLEEGTYIAADGDQFDFEQGMVLGNPTLSHFKDNDYGKEVGSEGTPVVGFRITSNIFLINYTFNFAQHAETDIVDGRAEDIEGSEITLIGRTYSVSELVEGTSPDSWERLTFIEGPLVNLEEDEEVTIRFDEGDYEVSVDFLSDPEVRFEINGQQTQVIREGDTIRFDGDVYLSVKEVLNEEVDFIFGLNELEVGHDRDVQLNDRFLNGMRGYVYKSSGTTTPKLDKIVFEWKTDEEVFLTSDVDLEVPLFEQLEFEMSDLVRPDEEKITIQNDGDTSMKLTMPITDGEVNFNLLFSDDDGDLIGLGKDVDERLATSSTGTLTFTEKNASGDDLDAWFVATNTAKGESYLLRAQISEDTDAGRNETDIQKNVDGIWVDVCEDKIAGDTCDIGDVSLTITFIEHKAGSQENVTITAGSNVVFDTIYTAGGLRMELPLQSDIDSNSDFYDLIFRGKDRDGNLATGQEFVLRIDQNLLDGDLQVSQIDGSDSGGPNGLEIGDSSTYETYIIDEVAPRILHYTNPDQDYAEIYYPTGDSETYAEVFLVGEYQE